MIFRVADDSSRKVKNETTKISHSYGGRNEKLKELSSLVKEGDVETRFIMKEKFGNLTIQNKKLKDENKALEKQVNQLQKKLEIVMQELQD